jgi:hypothetical protein
MGRPKKIATEPAGQQQITGFFGGQKRAADTNDDLHVDKRKCNDTEINTGKLDGCREQSSPPWQFVHSVGVAVGCLCGSWLNVCALSCCCFVADQEAMDNNQQQGADTAGGKEGERNSPAPRWCTQLLMCSASHLRHCHAVCSQVTRTWTSLRRWWSRSRARLAVAKQVIVARADTLCSVAGGTATAKLPQVKLSLLCCVCVCPALCFCLLRCTGSTVQPVREATVNKWQEQFTDLVFLNIGARTEQDPHPRAYCKPCAAAAKAAGKQPAAWTSTTMGATVYDRSTITQHTKSNQHQNVTQAAADQQAARSVFDRLQSAAIKRIGDIITLMLITVVWMLGNNSPVCMLGEAWLLFRALGFISVDHKYNHSRYVWAALHAVSEALMSQLLIDVLKSPFFALMFDLSSTTANEEHMLVYVRYLDVNTLTVCVRFLCCVRVVGKTGALIAETVTRICDSLGLDHKERLVAVCTDGDSANVGIHSGCVAVLRQACKRLCMATHCTAHISNLVMVDAQKFSQLLQGVDQLCKLSHNLFSRRPGRVALWQKFNGLLNRVAHKFPMFNATRWFTRFQCVSVLQQSMWVLLLFLHHHRTAKGWADAATLCALLVSVRNAYLLHALCDMLGPVEAARKTFEADDCRGIDIERAVTASVAAIESMFVEPLSKPGATVLDAGVGGACVRAFAHGFDVNSSQFTLDLGDNTLVVPLTGTLDAAFASEVKSLSSAIVAGLKERFSTEVLEILGSFSVFEPECYIHIGDTDALSAATSQKFSKLVKHFGVGDNRLFDKDEWCVGGVQLKKLLVDEFREVRKQLWQYANSHTHGGKFCGSFVQAWEGVKRQMQLVGKPLSQHMLNLVYVYQLTPVSTALVERGFSHHGAILSPQRNRTKAVTVDALMRGWHAMVAGKSVAARHEGFLSFAQGGTASDVSLMAAARTVLARAMNGLAGGSLLGTEASAALAADARLGYNVKHMHTMLLGTSDLEWDRLVEEQAAFWEETGGVLCFEEEGDAAEEVASDDEAGVDDVSVDWDALPESEGVVGEAGGEEVSSGVAPAVKVRRVRRAAAVMADEVRRCANAFDDDEFALEGL